MRERQTSRRKAFLYFACSLVFVAIGLLFLQSPGQDAWKMQWSVGFFGLCALIFTVILIRPQRLVLDESGFVVRGGMTLFPTKIYWQDIDAFFIYRVRGTAIVAYKYKLGARGTSLLARVNQFMGADGMLPHFLGPPQEIVDELNEYLVRAAQRQAR